MNLNKTLGRMAKFGMILSKIDKCGEGSSHVNPHVSFDMGGWNTKAMAVGHTSDFSCLRGL